MGLEVSEGLVTAVLVTPGDCVAAGDTVVEVETDKAIAEVEAPRDGIVSSILVEVGETVPVGATLIRIGDSVKDVEATGATEGAEANLDAALDSEAAADFESATAVSSVGDTGAGAPRGAEEPEAPSTVGVAPVAGPAEETARANGVHRRRAAPIARRAASRFGISLEQITGTGPGGRITLGDVERAAGESSTAVLDSPQASSGERLEPLSATRQTIARRLAESQLVPQYTLTREIDATWMMAEKARLSAAGPAKVGVLDLLVQAMAEALARHPQLAASFVPGADGQPPAYRHPDGIDLGLAVATDRGLLAPVIRRAHELTLPQLVLERTRLIEIARAGRLGPADMTGAAATLSSLGTFGVDSFKAMLNPGESTILAVGRTVEKVVPRERGLAVVPMLSLTFTLDHRVVDGVAGGLALTELAELLEGGMEWRT
jgi:pyruvate dehydrogenase E2 component (dihydrolipoamide acetyltransferase)